MIKLENYEVLGWEHVIRGMRNPMNSWKLSDSRYCTDVNGCSKCRMFQNGDCINPTGAYLVGENDLDLMKRLVKAGTDHSKFMRMITVYVDINAPLYWWKEFDTYKVGTVANSCSTMHKIHAKEFELDDFSCEHLSISSKGILRNLIVHLNFYRDCYNESKDKETWYNLIQLLPSSYNQKRTVQLNYAVLRNMYHSRKNHKLDEWHQFCEWIESLPYNELITMGGE